MSTDSGNTQVSSTDEKVFVSKPLFLLCAGALFAGGLFFEVRRQQRKAPTVVRHAAQVVSRQQHRQESQPVKGPRSFKKEENLNILAMRALGYGTVLCLAVTGPLAYIVYRTYGGDNMDETASAVKGGIEAKVHGFQRLFGLDPKPTVEEEKQAIRELDQAAAEIERHRRHALGQEAKADTSSASS
eukprot:Clim_evm97s109 gene=Clim_evmTU97s109